MHDTFISYAVEDNDFASDIAFGLKRNGLSVWFAPLSLKVGDELLDSIDRGIRESRTGVLVISKQYLAKGWTSHELDTLIRDNIENRKKLLPIWLNVTKGEIDQRLRGISRFVAITDTTSTEQVIGKLIAAMSEGAPSRAFIPVWEDPAHRFLEGLGEVNLQNGDGPATSVFEFLLDAKVAWYPLWLSGKTYSREDLLLKVAQLLGPDPIRAKNYAHQDGYEKLWKMCVEHGVDPNYFY